MYLNNTSKCLTDSIKKFATFNSDYVIHTYLNGFERIPLEDSLIRNDNIRRLILFKQTLRLPEHKENTNSSIVSVYKETSCSFKCKLHMTFQVYEKQRLIKECGK